ncbi:hypothetical protein [Streptomyces niveus]|uniref:hypothetical protein n=1 Tax=Streptomyces niveus TaxID=193462 RepID=UPI0036D3837B
MRRSRHTSTSLTESAVSSSRRLVEVQVRCLSGEPTSAPEFLNNSTLSEAWEHPVAACLAVLCLTTAGEPAAGHVATTVKHYLGLDSVRELAVFRTRVGLTVLDLSELGHPAEVVCRLIRGAVTYEDGYVARDVLSHAACREQTNRSERRTLSAAVGSAGLGLGQMPSRLRPTRRGITAATSGLSDSSRSVE